MSGRSASSVRDLLGKFEENSQRVSPPSRGRSPAGSDSTGSRPLSKVRTSFVAVERSGQMAPSLGKMSNNLEGDMGGDGQVDPDTSTNNQESDQPMANSNGNGFVHHAAKDTGGTLAKVKEEDAASGIREPNLTKSESLEASERSDTAAIDLGKPVSAVADDSPEMLPRDPEGQKAVSDGGSLLERRTSLGDLLKGHAFEQEANTKPEITKLETAEAQQLTLSSTPPSPPKAHSTHPKTNGDQPPEASTISSSSITENTKAPSTHPTATVARKDNSPARSTPATASTTIARKSPKSLKPSQDAGTSTGQPPSKTVSPKHTGSKKPSRKTIENQPKQAPAQKSSRPSAASKAHVLMSATSPRAPVSKNTSIDKKAGPTSPSTKTHPKSPTRPVRLPASLTAPTTASAAKLGAGAPARSPSRTSITTTSKPSALTKNRTPAVALQPRPKAPRASLPAPSAMPPKKPARTSIAGSKPADGGFLARMMRPTQSSASKTHEKNEPKTPPKKAVPNRPHKNSEEAVEHGADERREVDSVPPQDTMEPSHVPKSDTTQEGNDVDIHAGSVPGPEALPTNGEERGINGDGPAPSEAVST